MANKILKTYLSPDIVDYCVMPYLMISEEDMKEKYLDVQIQFHDFIRNRYMNWFDYDYETWCEVITPLKERYVGFWYGDLEC